MNNNRFIDEKYTQICSEKTLQTNQEGFFLDFAENVAEYMGNNWIQNTFGKLKTDKERIRIIFQDERIKDIVVEFLSKVREIYRGKCPEISRKRRQEAELCSKSSDTSKALSLYSQSILRCPQTDENFAISLLGRAKILIMLNHYSEALSDIQLALKSNLSPPLEGEAFWKMGICYKALSEENKATVAFNLAEKLLLTHQKKLLQPLKESVAQNYEGCNARIEKVLPLISGEKHPDFKCASSKITVKSSKEAGRYVVANKEIRTGETLVVEPAYAACLFPEKFGTHCHHCFERLVGPVGCPDCSSVAFCNNECKSAALATYHKYECKFLDLLIGSGMSVLSHTALRMITQSSLKRTLEIYQNRNTENVYKLCTNAHKRSPRDFLQRTLMAAFLLRCLQKSGYFKEIKQTDAVVPTKQEYQVGEMLLFHLQMLQFNAHEVYETLHSAENSLKEAIPTYIGVAVYPTVALFNHDCYPGVTRFFVGKHIVINAIRPLGPNDVIAENYGPIFTWRKLADRQRSLSARYWFNCQCVPCLENWPTLNIELISVIKRVRCTNEQCSYLFSLPVSKPQLKCPKCRNDIDLEGNIKRLQWCEEKYELGLSCLEKEEPLKTIEILCPVIDVFHKISAPPHRETHLAQEALRVCLANGGNRRPRKLKD